MCNVTQYEANSKASFGCLRQARKLRRIREKAAAAAMIQRARRCFIDQGRADLEIRGDFATLHMHVSAALKEITLLVVKCIALQ